MKVSKVNHIKTAVGISKNGKRPIGILYKDPADKSTSKQDSREYIQKRCLEAQRLYAVLNQPKTGEVPGNVRSVIRICNKAFSDAFRGNGSLTVEKVCRNLENQKNTSITREDIESAVIVYLKRSLQRTSSLPMDETTKEKDKSNKKPLTKPIDEQLVLLLNAGMGLHQLTQEERKMLREELLAVIRTDRDRTKIKKNLAKSLEHHNLVIQPEINGENTVIKPAVIQGASPRNSTEKDAFRRFLSDYADLDLSKRQGLLRRLRCLVDLYFYGQESVPSGDFDVWEDHRTRAKETKLFVDFDFFDKNDRLENNKEIRRLENALREANIAAYRRSIKAIEGDEKGLYFSDQEINRFWIHHIENEVERIYKRIGKKTEHKLVLGYLSEWVWKGILNYLCIKYVAIGKAVYNCAMENNRPEKMELPPGTMLKPYSHGINSFVYEQIKAEETLQRETAVAVNFAINHLASETIDYEKSANWDNDKSKSRDDDVLVWKADKLEACARPDSVRRIMQFFGGWSSWSDSGIDMGKGNALLMDLKEILYAMRNDSFHYTTQIHSTSWSMERIAALFERECMKCSSILKNKFYSNNLPMFYTRDDLRKCLNLLYARYVPRASQVPAFNTIFVRNNLSQIIRDEWKLNIQMPGDVREKWDGGIYYLLKEIYYNAYLADRESKTLFLEAIRNEKTTDEEEIKALDDFRKSLSELNAEREGEDPYTLSELCQIIMTEHNQQNNGNRRKKAAAVSDRNPDIYQHYKMLLYKGLRRGFINYITSKQEFSFLCKPHVGEKMPEEQFLSDYQTNLYGNLVQYLKEDPELQKWYIIGRLLSPKQANQLAGVLRHYEQYKWDIQRRARETGNILPKSPDRDHEVRSILSVLDMCIRLSGSTSNCLTDYFTDEEEYARYVGNFLDFEEDDSVERSTSEKLREFCNKSLSGDDRIGIFYDGNNPILNRNIVISKLYGNESILKNALKKKVTLDDLQQMHKLHSELATYQKTGICKNEDELKRLKKYQELKNRVEFRNLVEYMELIDELYGQLINWSYLRERDLLYFQLGFHYTCLNNSSEKPEMYQTIECDGRRLDQAILYQIMAIHTFGLPIYYPEGNNNRIRCGKESMLTSGKAQLFMKYTKFATESENGGLFFDAGLEVFQVMTEETNIIILRNYIDHFHYYHDKDRSLLSLYSEVFDRFFVNDMKYRKNVPNMLFNILLRHFVIADLQFGTGDKKVGKEKNKPCASIRLKETAGLRSDEFTYKLDQGKTVMLPARSRAFLDDIARILYYPEQAPESLVKESETRIKVESKRSGSQNKVKKGGKSGSEKETYTQSETLSYTLFANIEFPQ